ncbi:MAG: hypothetical protein J6112_01090, partial [Clostridia bacterium]|nr:hypothetical protein [Clostridia bacterium]
KTQERTVSRSLLRELSSVDKCNFKYLSPGTVDMFSRILSEKGTELDEKERLERLREHETYERSYEVPTPRYVAPGILDNGFGPYCADAGELVDDIIQRNNDIYGAGYIANRQSLEEINENIYLTDSEKEEAARRIDPLYMHR